MRALIAVQNNDESFTSITCESNAEPERLGRTLANHYMGKKDITALLKRGNINSLGATPLETISALGKAMEFDSEPDFRACALNNSIQYEYVFRNHRWYYRSFSDEALDRYTYIPPKGSNGAL